MIHPEHALAVDLPKVVKIQLPDQALEPVVAKVLGERFRLETREIRDTKGFPRWQPLVVDRRSQKKQDNFVDGVNWRKKNKVGERQFAIW